MTSDIRDRRRRALAAEPSTGDAALDAAAALVVPAQADAAASARGRLRTGDREIALDVPWRVAAHTLVRYVADRLNELPAQVSSGTAGFAITSDAAAATGVDARWAAVLGDRVAELRETWRMDPNRPIGYPVAGAEDVRLIGAAHTPWPRAGATVLDAFGEHVARRGDTIALADADRSWTYAELAAEAGGIAAHLREKGVGPRDIVAVGLPRRGELIAVLLGVWAAGAAFLPVDPAQPAARLDAQMSSAGSRFALLRGHEVRRAHGGQRLAASALADGRLAVVRPDSVAYAMATSGSTGRPKIVTVPHVALRHCVEAVADVLNSAAPTVAASTALTFDLSLLEIFLPLATGGRVLLADDSVRQDPRRFADWLYEKQPDIAQATPTMWRLALPYLPRPLARTALLCCGEALTAELAAGLAAAGESAWNAYGPTEATIYATMQRLHPPYADPMPIGRPLPGTVATVLDPQGRAMPLGQVGELYLAGPQLATGYHQDPSRTAAAFVHSAAGTAYRTGDLCSWRRDGVLTYHGRVDNQVKLRGHRVELEEIEAHAERHPTVLRAAAVVLEPTDGDQRLVLFCQARADAAVVPDVLRMHLGRLLPAALMPQHIAVLDRLPLTASQKVDRPALRGNAAAVVAGTPNVEGAR